MIDDEFKYAIENTGDGEVYKTPEDAVKEFLRYEDEVQFPVKVLEYRRIGVDKSGIQGHLQNAINSIVNKYFWDYGDFKPSPKICECLADFTNVLGEEIVPNIYKATGASMLIERVGPNSYRPSRNNMSINEEDL